MSKHVRLSTTLIIVESPKKCKQIESYLGSNYKCVATYGHIRTLPSLKNVDIDNHFKPTYVLTDKNVALLRKAICAADDIMIASDNDREGEMIGYSIIEVFKLPLTTKRLLFNEITESALLHAVANPTTINMNLVYAQQSRQILDLLVGFKVSPVLWKLVTYKSKDSSALSAGRCQTPALKLVYENQCAIDSSVSFTESVYNVVGYFTNLNLKFELNKELTHLDVKPFLQTSFSHSHIYHKYSCSSPKKIYKDSPEPFTTSRIQQAASNELHYSPKDTMRICQSLYEKGLITYMRTDSNTYSEEFVYKATKYIVTNYGPTYVHENINKITHNTSTDAAHEAIRPTNIALTPSSFSFSLEEPNKEELKEKRMYTLIWNNAMASCMSKATAHSITATITAPLDKWYTYTVEQPDFLGWKIIYGNREKEKDKSFQYLQTIALHTSISYKKIVAEEGFKGIPLHYTEARLVQLLEKHEIGRPSTFAYLIDKIQERGYVKKMDIDGRSIMCTDYSIEKNNLAAITTHTFSKQFGNEKAKLVIQPLGIVVIELLTKHFEQLFEYKYTANMERILDAISLGDYEWSTLCGEVNREINGLIGEVKKECNEKFAIELDEANTYIMGRHGPVIKCVEEDNSITFKSVKSDIDVHKLKRGEYSLEEVSVKSEYNLGKYNEEDVILRNGVYGLYITCNGKSKTLKTLGDRPMESILLEDVIPFLEEGSLIVREINANMSIRKGPNGDYLFYKSSKMKRPKFYEVKSFLEEGDYKICDISILKSWAKSTHKIE